MKPAVCTSCGSKSILVGRAKTQTGRDIHPHYCGDCGTVFATQQASKAELAQFVAEHGEPKRVYSRTEQRLNSGEDVLARKPHGKCCEVCGASENVEVHHWAPAHLFGPECDKWPIGYLCRSCHNKWHRLVTPGMAREKGKFRSHFDNAKQAREANKASSE